MTTITKAAQDVLAERARQVNAEGWTPEHDDEHDDGSLAMAAACYAAPMAKKGKTEQVDVSGGRGECPVWRSKWFSVPFLWPDSWHAEWWKPGREADLSVDGLGPVSRVPDRRRNLVRAAALLLAEIERLDRASGAGAETTFCNCARAGGSCVVRNGGRLPEPMRCAHGVATDGGKQQ